MTKSSYGLLVFLTAILIANTSKASITNGSFESGFSGWTTQDLGSPFFNLQVGVAGISPGYGLFTSAPTNGTRAALHGFDGGGLGTIRIQQDIFVSAGMEVVNFDYRGGWDMLSFGGSTLNRIFDVNIETAGGGVNLMNQNILTAQARTQVLDTGNLSGAVDLSSFTGQTVRLSFDWLIPQSFTGPAFFQLDNVRTSAAANGVVPEPATLFVWSGLGLAAACSFYVKKRKSALSQV